MSLAYVRSLTTKRAVGVAVAAILAIAVAAFFVHQVFMTHPGAATSTPASITARGRIEPLGRVRAVNGPSDGAISVIHELLVDQGSEVKAGQVLAVLDGFDVRRAEFDVAQASIKLAEVQQLQVEGGAKQAEIEAQGDVIAAKQAQFDKVQKQFDRQNRLHVAGVVSTESLDVLTAERDQAQSEVAQASNAQKGLSEVRDVDDRVAAAQIEVAKSKLMQAQAAMDRLQIRAPESGTVLSVQARAGEAIPADGLLRMADLSHLIVVAEIDESRMAKVKLGMKAQIDGNITPQPIDATVTRLGYEVYREKRPESDVLIGRDARIVEVELTPQTPLPVVVGGEVMVHLLPAQGDQP
jgi:HlyD family secretion protein